jgi:hypothetical protein
MKCLHAQAGERFARAALRLLVEILQKLSCVLRGIALLSITLNGSS